MKGQISIIGCGWLGFTLATKLVELGFKVQGSTTSRDKLEVLKLHGIAPFLVSLTESGVSEECAQFLTGSDTVIINIPPGLRRNPNKNHVVEIEHLIHQIEQQKIKHVLYISSTSVYEDEVSFPVITSKTIPNASSKTGKQLIEIEKMLQVNPNFKTTILRFGGLIGDDRHPGKFLSGRTDISNPKAPINLIHKKDCISVITHVLKKDFWDKTLNAVYPSHICKKDYYTNYCAAKNLPLPEFSAAEESKGKIVESKILVQLLNYTFKVVP
ncbi:MULTISPECIES: NAD(P)H-binding protein [Winogradskyella]|uniref:NAD(P)H-binding protein n=1 Tax=Winogradskyella TaxID=286104 RepID=UPI0015CECF2D|nr:MULTISPECIES: NAD(P)H-binding protein [Winogradskyella]QXP77374.1 NAD(P)H-binding protein [Winogradskyella sp. HaHa_3_26]